MDSTAVYRLYNAAGVLLYVGCTRNLPARMASHRAGKPWAGEIARTEVAWYDTRSGALAAETAAIIAEDPRHNVVRMRGTTPTTTFRLSPTLKRRVQILAALRGDTLTDIVNDYLRKYVAS